MTGEWSAVYEPPPPPPVSCAVDYARGNRESGLLNINPNGDGVTLVPVWCDHVTDGGGWTLVASVRTQSAFWTSSAYNAGNSARVKTLGSPNPEKNYARHDSAEHFSRLDALLFTATAWLFIPAYCFANPRQVLKLPVWKTLLDAGNFGGGSSKLRVTVARLDTNAEVTLGIMIGMSMKEPSFTFTNPTSMLDSAGNSHTDKARCVMQYSSDMEGQIGHASFDASDHSCTGSLSWNGNCGYTSLGHNGGYEGSGSGRFSHPCSLCQGYGCASDGQSCGSGSRCYYNSKWYWIK